MMRVILVWGWRLRQIGSSKDHRRLSGESEHWPFPLLFLPHLSASPIADPATSDAPSAVTPWAKNTVGHQIHGEGASKQRRNKTHPQPSRYWTCFNSKKGAVLRALQRPNGVSMGLGRNWRFLTAQGLEWLWVIAFFLSSTVS